VDEELNSAEYLRDLAERLMRVPVMYGTDQGDVSRLYEIAQELDNPPAREE
jgi:hypothetical protein